MELLEFKDRIWDLMRDIGIQMEHVFLPVASSRGLTMMQLRLLAEVRACGGSSVGWLGKRLGIAGSNISVLCKKLETAGFLVRSRDKHDERIVQVALTARGEQTLDRADAALRAKLSARFAGGQSPENLSQIIEGLEQLRLLLLHMAGQGQTPSEEVVHGLDKAKKANPPAVQCARFTTGADNTN